MSYGRDLWYHRIVKIGNSRGRIALYLDESEAIDLAYHYGLDDLGSKELLAAVEEAYPETAPARVTAGPKVLTEAEQSGAASAGEDAVTSPSAVVTTAGPKVGQGE